MVLRFNVLLCTLVSISALATACSSSVTKEPGYNTNPGADAAPSLPPGPLDAGTFTIDPSKPAFQVKSSTQLFNSVKACMGDGMLMITADMIQATGVTAPILPASFNASTKEGVDDIITAQKFALDGDPALLRQGTRADSLTLQYVTAQRNMANVVARNCAAGKNAQMCICNTPETATALLGRCMPQLDPGSPAFQAAVTTLQQRCTANAGTAIASFLASAAIAKLP